MRDLLDTIPGSVHSPCVGGKGMDALYRETKGMDVTTTFINTTGMYITVVTRANVKIAVENVMYNLDSTVNKNQFVVRETYVIHGMAAAGMYDYVRTLPDDNFISHELQVFRDAFLASYTPGSLKNVTVYVDSAVMNGVLQSGQDLFLTTKDLLITTLPVISAPDHPMSSSELIKAKRQTMVKSHKAMTLILSLVDNDSQIGDRHFFITKTHYKIKPHRDSLRRNGLYVTVLNTEQGIESVVSEMCYELSDLEEGLGMYANKEAAESGGDPKLLKTAELAELKHTNSLMEIELEAIKAKAKARELEMAAEKARLDQEMLELKHRTDTQKVQRDDVYHSRDHHRKDVSDSVKFMAAVTAGIVTIWIAMIKLIKPASLSFA